MRSVPDDVADYLRAVTRRVAAILGEDLIGLYVTGSLALAAYTPGRSDIDLMAVARGAVGTGSRQALVAELDHAALRCPATGLEFVLYPLATVARPTTDAGYLLDLNTGRELPGRASLDPADAPSFWYVIDRAVTHQSGWPLHGPAAPAIFRPLPYRDLVPVVIESVQSNRARLAGDLLDNAVLNGCRTLRFVEDRRWYAKLPAAEHTLRSSAEFAGLIAQAMLTFREGRRASAQLSQPAVRAFLDHVISRSRELVPDLRHLAGQPLTRDEALALRGAKAILESPADTTPEPPADTTPEQPA